MSVRTFDVLRDLGFTEAGAHRHDVMPGTLTYSFSDWQLDALECIGKQFRSVVLFTGVATSARCIASIEFEMPEDVESTEQAVAWLVFMLDLQAKGLLQPDIPWLAYGRAHQANLPWERRRAMHAARPCCVVKRDWMRAALREFRVAVMEASPQDHTCFSFDGEVLRIHVDDRLIAAVPARGTG